MTGKVMTVVAAALWATAVGMCELTTSDQATTLAAGGALAATSLAAHLRTRVPAVDVFEHGYRAGWEDCEALVRIDPRRASGGEVIPMTRRPDRRKIRT